MMELTLAARGTRTTRVNVDSLEDASGVLRAWLEANGYGQNDIFPKCGTVIGADGAAVARVSPNGKAWDTRPYPQCECLYDPYA